MPTADDAAVLTGVRSRTRTAIVESAISLWARDFQASLSEIAERAEVSRSTLHRYFPERESLITAALATAMNTLECGVEATVEESAPALDQLQALLRTMIDHGNIVLFLFSDPTRFEGYDTWDSGSGEHALEPLITQAQNEGSLAADVPPDWIVSTFYSLGYIAAEAIENQSMTKHVAQEVAIRTFVQGLGASRT